MTSDSRNEMFESAPIPRAVARMAIPSMFTMLVTVIYNMADTFFIGQTGDAVQVASVSLAMPVFSILMAVGSLFGMGGNSNISRSIGSGRKDRAKNISAFCFYGCIGIGIIIAAFMFIFMDPVMSVIGVGETNYAFTKSYLTYLTIGAPFVILANCCGNMLRGEGASTAAMAGNMIGTVANIILDPIFILVLGWGVGGAAIATVLGNVLACCYYLIYFLRSNTILSINPKNFKMGDKIASGVISIGVPTALNSVLMSVSQVVMNNTITQYGDIPLAAMNVALRTNMIVVFLQMGLCMGVMPLIGYCYGAGNKKRMVSIFRFTGTCTVILGTALTIFMVFARSYIVAAFIDDPEVITYGRQMVVALQISGPIVGLNFLSTSCLQGMGRAVQSMFLTICRQGIVYIPLILILNAVFGLSGLMYAQPVSDYIATALSFTVCLLMIRRFKPGEKKVKEVPASEQN